MLCCLHRPYQNNLSFFLYGGKATNGNSISITRPPKPANQLASQLASPSVAQVDPVLPCLAGQRAGGRADGIARGPGLDWGGPSVRPPVRVCVRPSARPFVLSVRAAVRPSACPSSWPAVGPSTHPFARPGAAALLEPKLQRRGRSRVDPVSTELLIKYVPQYLQFLCSPHCKRDPQ